MFKEIKLFLENIDKNRDKFLFIFIKKYWPRWLLPNHLTISRLFIDIFIFYWLVNGMPGGIILLLIFVFAALTDLFDGSVARALDEKTEFGAMLDVVADKLLIIPMAIFVLFDSGHYYLLLLLMIPEICNGLLVSYWRSKNNPIPVNVFGKSKMVVECFAFAFIILFDFPNHPSWFPLSLLYIGVLLLFFDMFGKIFYTKEIDKTKSLTQTKA